MKKVILLAIVALLCLSGVYARTFVFAGGTGEIGRGAVKLLAENGINVVLATHSNAAALALIDECEGYPGKVVAIGKKGSGFSEDYERMKAEYIELYEEVKAEFGSVDGLIISTGDMAAPVPLEELDFPNFKKRIANKVIECLLRIQAAVPYLRESGDSRIILTSNAGAMDGSPYENTLDEICGGAVISMTYALARELVSQGITVNCIARSGMINDHNDEPEKLDINKYVDQIPLGMAGSTEEYARLVLYIAQTSYMTGNVFNLSGGLHIGN